jgi:hypothetical protein
MRELVDWQRRIGEVRVHFYILSLGGEIARTFIAKEQCVKRAGLAMSDCHGERTSLLTLVGRRRGAEFVAKGRAVRKR